MSTYAIGDLQGCYKELLALLDQINFDEKNDQLWFVGDIVNRGPDSLACLRFVKSLGNSAKVTLGNHDLHLLAINYNVRKPHKKDTLEEILNARDAEDLLLWIRRQPLLVYDAELKYTMVHAGLPMHWTQEQAIELARETETLIKSKEFDRFIHNMYGDKPDKWSGSLKDDDRHRYIINCLTRMRYCEKDGTLHLKETGAPGTQPETLIPWHALPERKTMNDKIIFGHWSTATLGNESNFKQYNVYPLDTGCLWGETLTAMRLEDEKLFSVPSQQPKIYK